MIYTEEQTKDHRQQWVDALRSGKYKQGKLTLHPKQDKYCCLGVACDISKKGFWTDYDQKNGHMNYVTPDGDVKTNSLPTEIIEWLGLDNATGFLKQNIEFEGITVTSLAKLNDYDASFEFIANVIESDILKLKGEEI